MHSPPRLQRRTHCLLRCCANCWRCRAAAGVVLATEMGRRARQSIDAHASGEALGKRRLMFDPPCEEKIVRPKSPRRGWFFWRLGLLLLLLLPCRGMPRPNQQAANGHIEAQRVAAPAGVVHLSRGPPRRAWSAPVTWAQQHKWGGCVPQVLQQERTHHQRQAHHQRGCGGIVRKVQWRCLQCAVATPTRPRQRHAHWRRASQRWLGPKRCGSPAASPTASSKSLVCHRRASSAPEPSPGTFGSCRPWDLLGRHLDPHSAAVNPQG